MIDHKTLWIIPARGGSKGIPGKNIKPFCGTPLVCRSVLQASELAAPGDAVLVSTDSEEIANVARTCQTAEGPCSDADPFSDLQSWLPTQHLRMMP